MLRYRISLEIRRRRRERVPPRLKEIFSPLTRYVRTFYHLRNRKDRIGNKNIFSDKGRRISNGALTIVKSALRVTCIIF